jgi:ABC-type transport system involved in multi-copper enzyme maturation permease subunit
MAASLNPVMIVIRREIRDQLRDWRIVVPIVTLTLFFPILTNFLAKKTLEFFESYGADIIADRFIPFMLMIVGFFPITVSLVIALESFAGESERHSIEPLLSTPLADWQLYTGKLLASLITPLIASYIGISVELFGLYHTTGWRADPTFLIQLLLLTAVQATVMVSGAVVVSTQTTSVRAANLLASFIIIPMALLVQAESILILWANFSVLWWVIIGLVIVAVLLIRMGIAYFNREELLGREFDTLNVSWGFRTFKTGIHWTGNKRDEPGTVRKYAMH